MKKNLSFMWLMLLAILFSVQMEAQMTIGGKKEPEAYSVLELLNIGGLRLPQITTAQRNAYAVSANTKGEGLTIYNITTKCIEYWNGSRWVSLCEGTSQTTISPQPCIGVPADGSGCDQTFVITDPDCPNGPFSIAIVAGSEYASLTDVDNANGKFKVAFRPNETVDVHTVLVRVTSTCTSLYKDFLYSQNGIDCTAMPYTVPSISPATPSLTLCAGGSVYLSVPANTANLAKLIWTRNGIEVARSVNHITVTQPGKYNISMGAVGCNTNAANERTVTESGTVAPGAITALASNNGVMCGTNPVILSAVGATGPVVWFHNGVEEKTGTPVSITGDSNLGEWFAAVKEGSCYSTASNKLTITKNSTSSGQLTIPSSDVLVNGKPLNTFTAFCAGGTLDLSIANKQNGITYTWYNGTDVITTNPFIVPADQSKISLRLVATDNTGAQCPAELSAMDKDIITGSTPAQPNITGNSVICNGATDLTIVPAVPGTYTYTWYKDGVKMTETTANLHVTTPGVTYSASVTNATGCASTIAVKKIAADISNIPVLTWKAKPGTSTYGAVVSFQTDITWGPADSYTWTADNGATVSGTGASVNVQLPATGTDGTTETITVTATNSCGTSVALQHTFTMNNVCPTPALTAQTSTDQTVVTGTPAPLTVSATDAVRATYQWYSNTTAVNTGGTAISGATGVTYSYNPSNTGKYYFYCVVTNGCVGNPKDTSPVFTVTATINIDAIGLGVGTLTGKTCFDIAESNPGGSCGDLSGRTASKSDFNLATTNSQTYTFTPVGTVSKIRFVTVDATGLAVVSIDGTPDRSTALSVSGAQTATLVYKKTLSTGSTQGAAYGKSSTDAIKVDIYAVYNDNASGTGTDKKVKLTANIKDCICCGAYTIAASGGATVWRDFECYNVGASNKTLDPMTPNPGIKGTNVSFGYWTPGVQGPCSAGFRVPSGAELRGLSNALNTPRGSVGTSGDLNGYWGVKFGPGLMLPATTPGDSTYPLRYWMTDTTTAPGAYALGFSNGNWEQTGQFAGGGAPMRCISVN